MSTLKHTMIFLSIFLLAACSKDTEPNAKSIPDAKPIVLKSEFDNKINTNNTFAINLFKSTVKNTENANVFISPFSVNVALGMAWNGAAAETKNEMQSMLGNTGYTPEQINEYSKSLSEALLTVDPSTSLLIANSIWSRKGLPLEKAFLDANKYSYNATLAEVDFSSPATLAQINDWCSKNTNGKIPKVLTQLSPQTEFCLINALYFKGMWRHKFDAAKTTDAHFANENGGKQLVRMMLQEESLGYNETANWRCLSMPYGNNAFSMVILLPNGDKKLKDLIPSLTTESWNECLEQMNSCQVVVKLPRFKGEYTYNMQKDILPQLGMLQAFDPNKADFSKMCASAPLYITQVLHKTFVEVNEEGTEAAAVTVVSGDLMAPPPGTRVNFFVDQPFIYAIRENSTGTLLFMGKMAEM